MPNFSCRCGFAECKAYRKPAAGQITADDLDEHKAAVSSKALKSVLSVRPPAIWS